MEKVDLHVHLEGSLAPQVVNELARRNGLAQPLPFSRRGRFDEFDRFLAAIGSVRSVLRTSEDFELAAFDLGVRACRDGVRYLEVTVTPDIHRRERDICIREMSQALHRAATRLENEHGLLMRFIYDHVRSAGIEACERTVEDALQARDHGVVAVGLSGHELGGTASSLVGPIGWAQSQGLPFVAHAGELAGASNVREVVEMGALRVGHGIQCLEDPGVVALLVERRIALEVCLSSNLSVGCMPSLDRHPLPRLLDAGIEIVLGTDDPALFRTTLTNEYDLARHHFGLSPLRLAAMIASGIDHSFAPPADKDRLQQALETSMDKFVREG